MAPVDPLLTQTAVAGSQQAPQLGRPANAAEARQVAEDFESFFLAQVLEHMFAGVPTDGSFGGGSAELVYRSLLNQEFGRALSRAGGLGIADELQREILKLQEIA